MSATHVEFTPGSQAVLPAQSAATVAELPPPNPAYPATVLRNLTHQTVAIKAGRAGTPQFHAAGSITLQARQVLLTSDPAFAASDHAVVVATDGAPITGEGAMLKGDAAGTGVMFTRGSLRPVWLFSAAAVAVI